MPAAVRYPAVDEFTNMLTDRVRKRTGGQNLSCYHSQVTCCWLSILRCGGPWLLFQRISLGCQKR